jgi:enamine deaminase RidA (YjgF/YER057c/UK114 family)
MRKLVSSGSPFEPRIGFSRWEEAARAHGEVFSGIKPASTFVEVKGLIDPDWRVEIEADCVEDNQGRYP